MSEKNSESLTKDQARYEGLDMLRGVCALSIMFYHYFGWTFGHFKANSPLGRCGVYGVSLFYVLSGLTMFLVYFRRFTFSIPFAKEFYTKRFFRIFPLMWVVIILTWLVKGNTNSWLEETGIITGLFSVFQWDATTPLGMWSIGNELSFYLMLPFIFWALKNKRTAVPVIMTLIIFGCYFYMAYTCFNTTAADKWEDRNYKNPLNEAGLFLGGILIGYFFKNANIKPRVAIVLVALGLILFAFWPASGELRTVYIGNYRVVFTLICFIIALGFFKLDVSTWPARIKSVFTWFGDISYSLYLMHGLVWSVVALFGFKIRYVLPVSIVATFVVSYLVYHFLESPARNAGYKLLKKANQNN